jgi:hypothetical protein
MGCSQERKKLHESSWRKFGKTATLQEKNGYPLKKVETMEARVLAILYFSM